MLQKSKEGERARSDQKMSGARKEQSGGREGGGEAAEPAGALRPGRKLHFHSRPERNRRKILNRRAERSGLCFKKKIWAFFVQNIIGIQEWHQRLDTSLFHYSQ